MSTSAVIELRLASPHTRIAILRKLEDFGWSYHDHGKVTFLPIGDNDDFDWQHRSIPLDDLYKLLSIKEDSGELIGVAMTWKDSNIGGHFLLKKNGTVLVNLNINRKVIDGSKCNNITDINWYILKLVPVFNTILEGFSYEEYI